MLEKIRVMHLTCMKILKDFPIMMFGKHSVTLLLINTQNIVRIFELIGTS